jgi:energy-converting hydrogenase Eha subunit G
MTDPDIHAFTPASGGASLAAVPRPRQRRIWPWLLGGGLLLAVLLVGACAAAVVALIDSARDGMHVIVNGEPWDGLDLNTTDWGLVWLGTSAAVLVTLLVAPAVMLMGLFLGGLGLAVGLAATVGIVGVITAVLGSPLWLMVLLLWLLLRKRT